MMTTCPTKKAFTLVEVLVVIALISLIAVPGIIAVANMRARQALDVATERLTTTLSRAYIFAREEKEESDWGVRFDCDHSFSLWSRVSSGATTAAGDMILESPVVFHNCPSAVPQWIWFRRGTGATGSNFTLVLRTNSALTNASKQIQINANGLVQESL